MLEKDLIKIEMELINELQAEKKFTLHTFIQGLKLSAITRAFRGV